MKTTPFMDKQVMDLSHQRNKDFIDLMNPPQADDNCAGNEINTGGIDHNYDFHPILPISFSSCTQSSISDNVPNLSKAWNSAELSESNSTSTPIRNHISLDSADPSKVNSKADQLPIYTTFVAEIDRTMKNHIDNLMHALHHVGARITQLESRTRRLECSLDELKVTVENNHVSTQRIMWQFENLLREVQSGVQVLNDKQEVAEAQMQMSKLQVSKIDQYQQSESHGSLNSISEKQMPSGPKTSHPHHSSSTLPTLNAPLQPPPLQSPPSVYFSNQFPQNQLLSGPPREPYFPLPAPTQEVSNLLYKLPQIEQGHPSPTQYEPRHSQSNPSQQIPQQHAIHASIHPPPTQYEPRHSQSNPSLQIPQQHAIHASIHPQYEPRHSQSNPSLQIPQQPAIHASIHPPYLQPSLSNHAEETQYLPLQDFQSSLNKPPYQPDSGPSSSQHGAAKPMFEPLSRKTSSEFPGPNDLYNYGRLISPHTNATNLKPPNLPSAASEPPIGGSGYSPPPPGRTLPHALPTASEVSGGSNSGSAGSGNRVPVSDVVDKVTNMGFPREQVRVAVRKLTENGQSVDLNVVLDKLMKDGEVQVQQPRGWFGR